LEKKKDQTIGGVFLVLLKPRYYMISKIKYAGIFIVSTGYLLKVTQTGVGPIQGNTLMAIGIVLIAGYALVKLLGK